MLGNKITVLFQVFVFLVSVITASQILSVESSGQNASNNTLQNSNIDIFKRYSQEAGHEFKAGNLSSAMGLLMAADQLALSDSNATEDMFKFKRRNATDLLTPSDLQMPSNLMKNNGTGNDTR